MRHVKLLGLALMAIFAFGVLAAASASAEEPAGILFLAGVGAATEVKGEVVTGQTFKQLGLKSFTLTATLVKLEGELCKSASEEKHCTLGSLTVDYTGVKLNKLACSSENIKGEKDPKETILLVAADTDVHLVSLENSEGKLVPGWLVGLLELEEGGKKLDPTMNCANGAKIPLLGALFFEVKGVTAGSDLVKAELLPNEKLKCDAKDELCKKEREKWGVKATKKVGEKDETVFCPLGAFIEIEEECSELSSDKPIPVTFSKDVLIDF